MRISFASLIASVVFFAAAALVAAILLFFKAESDATAIESSEILFQEVSSKTIAEVHVTIDSIAAVVETAALGFNGHGVAEEQGLVASNLYSMKAILDSNPSLMSVYLGYEDGAFHQLIAPRENPSVFKTYAAPMGTVYIDRIISVAGNEQLQQWRFLDEGLVLLAERTDPEVTYDPRKRPWYTLAMKSDRTMYTDPYIFSSSRLPGLTCARRLADDAGVLGVDITLAGFGELLERQAVTKNGAIWMLDGNSRLLAYPGLAWEKTIGDNLRLPEATESRDSVVRAVTSEFSGRNLPGTKAHFLTIDDEPYMAAVTPMCSDSGLRLSIVMATPLSDITGHFGRMALSVFTISVGLLVLMIPFALLAARRIVRPIHSLMDDTERIKSLDFSPTSEIFSCVSEIQQLADANKAMKATLHDNTEALRRTQSKLEELVKEGLALAEEKELAKLVTLILLTARGLTGADGGVIYLKEQDQLGVELLSLGDESLVLGGLSENPAPRVMVRPEILPFLEEQSVLHSACEAFAGKKTLFDCGDFSLFPTGLPEEPRQYAIQSLITVPIVTRRDELLGVIQLFNVDSDDVDQCTDFVGALAAQAAVAIDNRNLVASLQDLFDSLIQVIAASIDAKSPYTAGHCSRVPELCEMLAQAVHECDEGPLSEFKIDDDNGWRQLWIASWLHDCGKVTTPEFVIDKGTKLETVHNRIHEVRTRFEVLRRDAEIEYYKKLVTGDEDPQQLRVELDDKIRQLEDDFDFVAQVNTGGEFLSKESQERLKSIAERTWMRFFDDRLGISHIDLQRAGKTPEVTLPVPERLLADKPEHLIARHRDYSHIKDAHNDPIEVPEYEFNRGELYNLLIARGTLTAEERFIINEHTLSGLEMLAQIPFPDGLKKAPEIAMGHHETLVGSGYPLKKSKDLLMVESRILAIADIFEALTASDRPYKKSKTVSEALRIMGFMRNDQHIDPDIFDIFLRENIFRKYAEKHLSSEQDDVEDPSAYLTPKTSA